MASMYNEFVDEAVAGDYNYPDENYDNYNQENDDYGRGEYPTYAIPEDVKKYITYFRDAIRENNVYDIPSLYVDFSRLTEEYFKTQAWPDIEDLYGNKLVEKDGRDDVFLILYRELYYRHIYARVQGGPTIAHRFESYYNYCNFFNFILIVLSNLVLQVANRWPYWVILVDLLFKIEVFILVNGKLKMKSRTHDDYVFKGVPRASAIISEIFSFGDKIHVFVSFRLELFAPGNRDDITGKWRMLLPFKPCLIYFNNILFSHLQTCLDLYYFKLIVDIGIAANMYEIFVIYNNFSLHYGITIVMESRYPLKNSPKIVVYLKTPKCLFTIYFNIKLNKSEASFISHTPSMFLSSEETMEAFNIHTKESLSSRQLIQIRQGDDTAALFCFHLPITHITSTA
ncbi:unnamed protein product [Meganyctiphanes norvegica]|uniref:Uncharacterized protein n=1 Tax=Meganyctiphanes norvegica TaxID=48144 RepID=A0AAV2S2V0_MEGNR